MHYIIVFGSLRKHSSRGYNFNRCGRQEYIKTLKLKGFDLYDLGPYPAVCRGDGILTCELHEVDDATFRRIDRMEIGAGYTAVKVAVEHNMEKVEATIYTWPESALVGSYDQVESGDWS